MGKNPVRKQFRPIFGAVFDEISSAADWSNLTVEQQADRLREAMGAEDKPRFYRRILIRPDQFRTLHSESVAHSRTRK